MSEAKVIEVPEYPLDEELGEVVELPVLHGADSEVVTDEPIRWKPPGWLVILVAVVVLVTGSWLFLRERENDRDQSLALADATSQLETTRQNLLQTQIQIDSLEAELADTQKQLEESVDLELYATLQQSEAELIQELSDERVRIELQAAQAAELQQQIDTLEDLNSQLQTEVDTAQAEARSEAARANQAELALDTELGLVPQRAENLFGLLAGVSLGSAKYDLGQIRYDIIRPGLLDDEKQYFQGSVEVKFTAPLEKVSFVLMDDGSLRAILPLPQVVPDEQVVPFNYKTWTDREQLARIGGRWGEQTEMFVINKAHEVGRIRACNDIAALRAEMAKLRELATAASEGHSLQLRWIDHLGVMWDSVSDSQLKANAC